MFSGSWVALVTPMNADGTIDWRAWVRLLDFHVQAGTTGVVVAGTTGESASLTDAEVAELTRAAMEHCRGRLRIVVGAGAGSTASTVERSRKFSSLGPEGLMIVTPFYNKPPQEGLFRHFWAAAEASAVPIIVYNVPSRTAVDLLPATVARLAAHARIVGIKDATASIGRLRDLKSVCPEDFSVLSGDDATAIDWIRGGACGVISVTSNVAPLAMADAIGAALAGDMARAAAIDARLQALHRDLFIESSPIPVKWCLAHLGLISNHLRLPLVEMSAIHGETLMRALHTAGISLPGRAA